MLSQHGSGDAESWYWERLDICHIAAKMDSNRLRNDWLEWDSALTRSGNGPRPGYSMATP